MARKGENIYKRKDGRYEGRFIKGRDSQGKAIWGSVYAKTYAEVKSKLAESKSAAPYADMTLSEWLELWLNTHEDIKPNTKAHYKNIVYNHLIPEMGSIKLKMLNHEHIQAFVNKESMNLSPASVLNIFTVLKSALKCALYKGYIKYVWDDIKLPQKQQNDIRILTKAEQDRLDIMLSKKEDIGILLSLYAGLRIGEVCALKWENINFETATLTVAGTQVRTEKGLEVLPPKTKSSYRKIPLTNFLLEKLRNMPHECEFVLSKNKKAIDVRTYRNYFKRKLRKLKYRIYAIMHFVILLLQEHLSLIQTLKTYVIFLGIPAYKLTMNIFIHSLNQHKVHLLRKMEI